MEDIAQAFEWVGIAIIVGGALLTIFVTLARLRTGGDEDLFLTARQTFGRALLLSLEVFVAANLITTVAVDLSFKAVGTLGLLVVIRTILSFSIDVEINGVLPWRSRGS